MKTAFRIVAITFSLLIATPVMAGCSQLASLTKNEQVSTYDEKALFALEVSYDLVLSAIGRADAAGFIDKPTADKIIPILAKTQAAIKKARDLYDQGQAIEASASTAAVFAALTELTTALRAAGLVR
jgi:hypothetical protein